MATGEIVLASGRTIQLVSLHQWAVYAGLLEGLPTRRMNDAKIERMRQEARERTGHEPFVIEPKQKAIEISSPYPFGEPAALPPIGCIGDFVSDGFGELEESLLTIIWFQHEYAFPPSAEVVRAIAAIDWDRVARSEPV